MPQGLVQRQVVDPALRGLVEVQGHALDTGEHDQGIGVQVGCQHRAGQVLVDHGGYTAPVALLIHLHGDPPTATGDGDHAGIEQGVDGGQIEDLARPGAGHNAPPAATGVLGKGPACLGRHFLRLGLREELAHRLGGVGEGRIGRVDFHLGDDAGHHHVQASIAQHVGKALLQHVAHATLGVRHTDVHRHGRQFIGRARHAVEDVAHHRAIAVREHQLPALPDDLHQVRTDLPHQRQLLVGRALDRGWIGGVATQGHDHTAARGVHCTHVQATHVPASQAALALLGASTMPAARSLAS